MQGIRTKKSVYEILDLETVCSYKTLVVNMNRFASVALVIMVVILQENNKRSHLIKYTDSTDIPVCSLRKAHSHKTMKFFSAFGKTGKGWFYGLKMHITADFEDNLLAVRFTPGNVADVKVFEGLNKNLNGIFIADAAYLSEEMARRFNNSKRIIFSLPRFNMRKIVNSWQLDLIKTRMKVEIHFNLLKQFFQLITSLPRSVNGFFANYIYSLLAYLIKQSL